MMTGRRPARSLRRPHAGLTNTHSEADVAKIVETWNGVMPISRDAGGRIENSIDCPMPTDTRHTKSSEMSRRNGDRGDSAVSGCADIRAILRVRAPERPRGGRAAYSHDVRSVSSYRACVSVM